METSGEIQNNPMLGRRVGAYELKREIGRGGMGTVYLAERVDGEFKQRVAVKLIKRGMDTDLILKRFRRERQILAALDHPNITYFLSGDSTEDGLPFFVMEYIEGKALYQFCDNKKLSVGERLRIFQQICAAVHAAHQIKVIHRDLKPSNILVKADGTPKLLDFGIAKVLDPELAVTEIDPTATQMRVMTPEYASPEQMSGDEITPASDIYSLGVLLYELLTGHRPYRLKKRPPHEIARIICEEMPSRPSGSVSREDNLLPTYENENFSLEFISETRRATLRALQDQLSGDLDKIILKALRKTPAERYQSARDFADDISNYLAGRPVSAETFPDTRQPQDEKYSVAVLPFKMLGAADSEDGFLGLGLTDALVMRLSAMQRLIVRPTSSVMRFADSDSFTAGRTLGVKYVVDGNIRRSGDRIRVTVQLLNVGENSAQWAEKFDEKSADVLELEDSISEKVVNSLLPQLTGEEKRQISKRGTNNAQAYEAYMRGRFHFNQFTHESFPKIIDAYEEAVRLDPEYALAWVGIADFYNWASIYGMFPSLENSARVRDAALRALEIDPGLGEAYAALGLYHSSLLEHEKAEENYHRAIALNPAYPHAHEWLAATLVGTGRFEEGVREMRLAEKLDPLSLRTKTLTAWTSYQARYFEESAEKAREIISLDPNYPQGHLQLGNVLPMLGKIDEAVEECRKAVEAMPISPLPVYHYCFALVAAGQIEKARRLVRDVDEKSETTYVQPYFLATLHVAVGEIDRAFEYFEKAYQERSHWLLWFGTEPKFDSIRDDERYIELFRRMNNPLIEKQISRPTSGEGKSIAVLPLKILGTTDAGGEFLGIGLADALITRLSGVKRFILRPTGNVLRYSAGDVDPFVAGRELGVEYVVDGNIRQTGDRIRLTAQLLDVEKNTLRWSQSFDEKFTDVLELEDSISERVVNSLLPQLSDEEQRQISKRGTNNAEAYEAYLRGRFYWSLMTEESFARAIKYYERAVELDPNYALAHIAIAEYYTFLAIHCIIPFAEGARRTKAAAERAAAIDPTLADTQAALGIAAINHDFDWERSEYYLRRAVEINPNSILARNWYQALLFQSARFGEAWAELDHVLRLNPDTLLSSHYLAWAQFHTRRFDESIETHRQMLAGDPHYAWGHLTFSWTLRCAGQWEQALAEAQRALELSSGNPMYLIGLAAAQAAAGEREKALETVEQIKQISSTRYVSPYILATVYCSLDDKEKVFEQLEKAIENRDVWIVWLVVDPQFDLIRGDERYAGLLRRMNHPLASG